jgi:hypothetical protein
VPFWTVGGSSVFIDKLFIMSATPSGWYRKQLREISVLDEKGDKADIFYCMGFT